MRTYLLFCAFLLGIITTHAQETPILRVDVRQNLLTQKIDILDGPKMLSQPEIRTILQINSEALYLYEKSLNKQRINNILSFVDLGLFVSSTVLAFTPKQQSSQVSNLFWPFLVGSLAVGITSGFFRREARNLAREAVDSYNFGLGPTTNPSIYFEENLIREQPIFSFRIPLKQPASKPISQR